MISKVIIGLCLLGAAISQNIQLNGEVELNVKVQQFNGSSPLSITSPPSVKTPSGVPSTQAPLTPNKNLELINNILGFDGEVCSTNNVTGVCKELGKCPSALQDIQNGKIQEYCGHTSTDLIVCCLLPSSTSSAMTTTTVTTTMMMTTTTATSEYETTTTTWTCRNDNGTDCGLESDLQTPELKQECGWSYPRGNKNFTKRGEAQYGEFPWMCAVLKTISKTNEKTGRVRIWDEFICNGALFHHSVVLVNDFYHHDVSVLKVRAGIWNGDGATGLPKYQVREVSSTERAKYNFYGLLFLTAPMTPAPNVGVACLPPPAGQPAPEGTRCVVTRWNDNRDVKYYYQKKLEKVEMSVMEHIRCQHMSLNGFAPGVNIPDLTNNCLIKNSNESLRSGFICFDLIDSFVSCPIETIGDRFVVSGMLWGGSNCNIDPFWVYHEMSGLRTWIDEKVIAKGYDPEIYTASSSTQS